MTLMLDVPYQSLRERLRAPESLRPGAEPLLRLGALYQLRYGAGQEGVREKIEAILAPEPKAVVDLPEPELLLQLHAAVVLAQAGGTRGVDWLLAASCAKLGAERRRLLDAALRSCSQYPLLALSALAFQLAGPFEPQSWLRRSETELAALADRPDSERHRLAAELAATLRALPAKSQRAGVRLREGFVFRRPTERDHGFRHTGFLLLPDEKTATAFPFGFSDLLNRDDDQVALGVTDLLGREPRRAWAVVRDGEGIEAVYLLPFATAESATVQNTLNAFARQPQGLTLGVVVELLRDKERPRFRVAYSDGSVSLDSYDAHRRQIGDCLVRHPDNGDRPLSTVHRLNPVGIGGFLRGMFGRAPTSFGVALEQFEDNRGSWSRVVQAQDARYVLRKAHENGTVALWEESYQKDGNWYTNLLPWANVSGGCPTCYNVGSCPCPKCEGWGTIFCTTQGCRRGKVEASCPDCAGHGVIVVRQCDSCEGSGKRELRCTVCGGTGYYEDSGKECIKCHGSPVFKVVPCRDCRGSGNVTRNCETCRRGKILVDCSDCKGTGKETCPTCEGHRIAACSCGGKKKDWTVEVNRDEMDNQSRG